MTKPCRCESNISKCDDKTLLHLLGVINTKRKKTVSFFHFVKLLDFMVY